MNLTVEWVHEDDPRHSRSILRRTPVIRVATLRKWFQEQAENGATIDDIFLQLPDDK